ncbi:MAG: selenocysteine-specific translation elongation factor [Deltaproteobacteria bacterium]|nr:selenocysteine-specific translation elongation factor [Deltaproteobacteria bacterium]
MKNLILGTAGHIDHGKTALVRLLTGIDCDRLPEEKARGITIELGFASLDLPGGVRLGIVDVPGHERFVHTMVAGAAGIDLVMLIVAADEGVMPQTREHFDICRLLGVRAGLVALTKADLVDADMLDLARADVADYVEGSFLGGAPIVPVSSVTGAGRDDLILALAEVAAGVTQKNPSDLTRLPIDRVFTMKGFGTVVTGTLASGALAVGEDIVVMPDGPATRIRGLQAHGAPVERANAGQRTAVNLQGVAREDVRRGQVVAKPGTIEPASMIDVRLHLLPTAPRALKRRARVRFHAHTSDAAARVIPLSADEIEPGGEHLAQLRLEHPMVLLPGDRFVLRSWSPLVTIGGGTVVHARGAKYRRPLDAVLADLVVLESGSVEERLAVLARRAGVQGIASTALRGLLGASQKDLDAACGRMLSTGVLVRFDEGGDRYVSGSVFATLRDEVRDRLDAHHRAQPDSPGLTRGDLAARALHGTPPRLLARALAGMQKDGTIEIDGDTVRRTGHRAAFAGEAMSELTNRAADALMRGGIAPPTPKEIAERLAVSASDVDRAIAHLVKIGKAVRLTNALYFDREKLDDLLTIVRAHLASAGEIDAQSFKDLTGLSRKFAIPLLEYCDAIRLTLRVGDRRIPRTQVDGKAP